MVNHSKSKIAKVLIANRGEIAIRIIRAARDAGIASVAIYSESDIDSLHVKLADESFAIGGKTAAESYLIFEKILKVAIKSNANAIHPGYGFLSESAEFAQAVLDSNLIWIGPSPKSIHKLGDKVTARNIAKKACVPIIPGTFCPVRTSQEVLDFIEKHDLPVTIKAAFGGGGRGMKVIHSIKEVPEMFSSAAREALVSFGRGECLVEKYIDKPRHIETQIVADMHGNVILAGTRDCSIQRRFQKLIEEAPAPFLTCRQIEKINKYSKLICKETNYYGIGTVEYLMSQSGEIFFLEFNTRLQVEHSVTEETSGIDLVRQQFKIANGETLSAINDLTSRGHAFEFRINGEDAGRNFLPMPGLVTKFEVPSGPGIRIDAGIEGGSKVGGQFDSMLAKLTVTGANRKEALERSLRALSEFNIEGIATTIPFHRAVVADKDFIGNEEKFNIHTNWIENQWNNKIKPFDVLNSKIETNKTLRQKLVVEVDGRRLEVSLPKELYLNNKHASSVPRRRSRSSTGNTANNYKNSDNTISAPMQGTVVKIFIKEGDKLIIGDKILVLEAMKMENLVTAHKNGVITNIGVGVGDSVTQGAKVAEII